MLSLAPTEFRKNRKLPKRKGPQPAPPPAALTLVSAVFDADTGVATLVFDRAIDIAGLDPMAITVNDPVSAGNLYDAEGGASLTGPATLRLVMQVIADATGSIVTLSATGASGIVASDDGGTWAGVTDVALPWP